MASEKQNILTANLARMDRARTGALEKQLAHLGELADLLCDEAGEEEIFFRDEAFAAKYRALTERTAPDVAAVNRKRIASLEKGLSAMEKGVLLCRLCDTLGIRGLRGAGTFFGEPSAEENETVSYLRSSYADTAYRVFTEDMVDPKVLYGHEFAEACENVYYGRCAYAILPLENSTDGRLAGFRGLIMKYGLKIASVCRVQASEDEGSTLFALLKRTIDIPADGGEHYFEFRVETEDLFSLLAAAEVCGMQTVSVSSVSGSTPCYDLVMRVAEEGFCGFLSFLHLEHPDFVPTGLFGEKHSGKERYHGANGSKRV